MNAPPPYTTVPTNGHETLRFGLELAGKPEPLKKGPTVSTFPIQERHTFIRKVYTILFLQILATCTVTTAIFYSPSVLAWVNSNDWAFTTCLVGALVNVAILIGMQDAYPLNFVLLATFTSMEAFTMGVKLATLDEVIVLQALIITTGLFLGLTLFTFQTKWDFNGAGPYLYAGLVSLVMVGISRAFFQFGDLENMAYALAGSIVFSGFIIYDTHLLTETLGTNEYIWGSLRLYLDFISLFIYILRVLADLDKKKKEAEAEAKEEEEKAQEEEKKAKGKGKGKEA